jgi:hypothetical protein
MLGMAVAAVSFAACNKEDITPSVEQGNKSVTLSLANVLQTKSASNKVAADEIQLNSFQVFFSDGTDLYSPKTVDGKGTATTRFTQQEADGLYEFHFLPKAVNQVIVVGNMAQLDVTTHAALLAAVKDLTVGGEQNPANVRLMGIDTSLEAGKTEHVADNNTGINTGIQHPDPYVHADVNLSPAVARFEITGFEYALKTGAEKRNYTTMTVDNLSIRNYYTKAEVNFANVPTTEEADLLNFGGALTKDNVYVNYFNVLGAGWWLDKVGTTLDADAYAAVVNVPGATETEPAKDCYAYNVFPGALPQFLMQLTGAEGGVESPLYLMTSALKVKNANNEMVALTAEDITAGNVYRMAMKFDDNNLQNPEKCIEVSITVDEWVVVAVTPEF